MKRMKSAKVFLLRQRGKAIVTLCLAEKKPWSIDPSYFSKAKKPLYLVGMAVAPKFQGKGIGRRCMAEVEKIARAWPTDAIRLDSYDAPAGAGGFYASCGYREVASVVYRDVPLIYHECVLDEIVRA